MSKCTAYALTFFACSVVFALGCGDDGDVGDACSTDSDCDGGLTCISHDGRLTCQNEGDPF
ncbi:MAG: hypothetical protein RJA70_2915 [Pseudomonadota bacterium]|jgi:hypothetical protein